MGSGLAMGANPFRFILTATREERTVLVASTLGWALDGMDVTLYAMVLGELLREFRLSPSEAGLLASVTLIASGVGGIVFGFLADRIGRRNALMISMAWYSVFTAACGLARGAGELAVYRFLLGLGMGGEWATGAALVAETWRDEHRGKALGLMQSGFAIGYAMAAVVAALVMPRWGWRAVFFVGISPALVTLWIRRRVPESPLWHALHRDGTGHALHRAGSGRARPPDPAPQAPGHTADLSFYLRVTLLTLTMNAAALFAWWGLFTWIPTYLALPTHEGGRGLTLVASSIWIGVMQAGMWLGYVSFGFLSDRLGRKKTYVGYLLIAAALVPVYAGARAPAALLALGPLVAFFGTGHFTGFGIITAEIFPTSFRGSAMGLTYNFGRGLSAAAPWAIGALAQNWGLSSAFALCGVAYLVAGLLALGLPETRHRHLA